MSEWKNGGDTKGRTNFKIERIPRKKREQENKGREGKKKERRETRSVCMCGLKYKEH